MTDAVPEASNAQAEPSLLQMLAEAERSGAALLIWRNAADGRDRFQSLADLQDLTIGRSAANALIVDDAEVSRVHAQIERLGDVWAVLDDGISKNGTYVNGQRVVGRRRLLDGDVLTIGRTDIRFHDPASAEGSKTVSGVAPLALEHFTPAQRRVLEALCRPSTPSSKVVITPSNREIADALHVGESSVKAHLRRLYVTFEVPDLPHDKKRAKLAELAITKGVVTGKPL